MASSNKDKVITDREKEQKEKEDAEKKKKEEEKKKKEAAAEEKKKEAILTPWEQGLKEIRDGVSFQGLGTINKDRRLLVRAARQLSSIRQRLKTAGNAFAVRLLRRTCGELLPESIKIDAFATIESKLIVTEKDEEDEKKDKEREDKQKEAYAAAVAAGTYRPKSPSPATATTDAAATSTVTATPPSPAITPAATPATPATTDAAAATGATTATAATETKDKPVVIIVPPYVPDPVHLALPEVRIYIQLIIAQFVADNQLDADSVTLITSLVTYLQTLNRRTADLLSAKVYGLWSLAYERVGRLADIREALHIAHQTATIQHNEVGVAVLANNILRNYLHFNLYDHADKFHRNSTFPEAKAPTQHARYLYYIGRIAALHLHYSDAYNHLTSALRKAPQRKALGFRQRATKLLVVVQLLMGDIPDRAVFRQKDVKRSLHPYFRLTQAVRVGDLESFGTVTNEFKSIFLKDGITSLLIRLRQNVIKTGLRKINLSYSRISIADITARLKFDTQEDCEYVVAKAIHDGVIEAVIDRAAKFVYCKQNTDVYTTTQPQAAFHKRIDFCTSIHNEAVKALSFPPGAHKSKILDMDMGDLEDDEDLDPETKDKPPLVEDGHDH